MINHAPKNYQCPFCIFVDGGETHYNKREDIVYEDKAVLAFISPRWGLDNPGNVIVIPKKHFENIYDIPEITLSNVYKVGKKIAIAIKKSYRCDGISMRQHNEPLGEQEVFHFHLHVFPRIKGINLYQDSGSFRTPEDQEKVVYADMLRSYFEKQK